MKILYMGNNWTGWHVLQWLRDRGDEIVGLVVHPSAKRTYGPQIIEASGLEEDRVFDGSTLRDPAVMKRIKSLGADIGLSVLFGYVLRKPFLDLFPHGCLNLHPAYLPYNRGAHPNVWSIIDRTPAGVTLHRIDESIDTGKVLARKKVKVESVDTGKTLYRKCERASLELFEQAWPKYVAGKLEDIEQDEDRATHHYVKEFEPAGRIELDAEYRARDLIDLVRARSFDPYPGAWFIDDRGRKVHVSISLQFEPEEDGD